MKKIFFVGLGTMGYPMAGHLKSKGHDVTVYNRSVSKAKRWSKEFSGKFTSDILSEAAQSDIIFACVGNDEDVREIAHGKNGLLRYMKQGSIFVDHTTASSSLEIELNSVAKALNIGFIDAPVSGGEQGAKDGTLTIMCGGKKATFQQVKDVMAAYSMTCIHMGKIGNGQLTKMVNQICISGILQGLSEAVNFAQNAKIDINKMVKVISQGAAGSWQLKNRGETMAEDKFDFGFAVDWMRKDLSICLKEAESNGSPLPLTSIVDQFYKEVQLKGGGRLDTSSLITRLKHKKSAN